MVVLQVDTSAGDSTRTIIQRDFDYGDRMQPLILDSATLDDIWRPGQKNINFAPLAQTRANFVVRARPTTAGLHVEVYDVPRGRLRQEDYFRLPKGAGEQAARDQGFAVRDSRQENGRDALRVASGLCRARQPGDAQRPSRSPAKTTRDRAKRALRAADAIPLRRISIGAMRRCARAPRGTRPAVDSVVPEVRRSGIRLRAIRSSASDGLAIHVVSDEIERWITGLRGIAATQNRLHRR